MKRVLKNSNEKFKDYLTECLICSYGTYSDTDGENGCEFRGVGCVRIVQKDLFLDPLIVHCVENRHSNPEPNVEGCEHAAEIATLLQAAHTGG